MSFTLPQAPDGEPRAAWFSSLAAGGLHEFHSAAEADSVSLCAFVMMATHTDGKRFRLWIRHEAQEREGGAPCPAGLAELGFAPAEMLFLRARDVSCALQGALEGARCSGLGAVIVELRGESKAYDLTASRRLALAAQASGVSVLVARMAAAPRPSAAQTRWQVRAMPSRALAANAPGPPAFELTLLRARNGQEGLRYCVEWDRDARQFIPRSTAISGNAIAQPAPLSGAVVPVFLDRQGAMGPWRAVG